MVEYWYIFSYLICHVDLMCECFVLDIHNWYIMYKLIYSSLILYWQFCVNQSPFKDLQKWIHSLMLRKGMESKIHVIEIIVSMYLYKN